EVPISYRGRTYAEGKKATWTAGLRALGAILRYGLLPSRASSHAGYDTLSTMDYLSHYNSWLWRKIAPSVGERILEAGCGTGTITRFLAQRGHVLAVDVDPHYVSLMTEQHAERSNIQLQWMDLTAPEWPDLGGNGFDTVVCMNVLEHLADDEYVLCRFYDV